MFVATPVSDYTDFVTVIPAVALNYWKNILPDALDAIAGGVYNIQAAHVISFPAGGGSWNIAAQFTFSDGNIPDGGNCDVDSGATITVKGTTALDSGGVIWEQYAYAQWESGSFCSFLGGSQVSLIGSMSVSTGGGSGLGKILIGATGTIEFTAGGVIKETALLTGTQPAKTADPGGNNALCGTNQCKAWGAITTDGSGAITLDDGYNTASVAIVAGNIEITFARAMANANYAVIANLGGATVNDMLAAKIISRSTTKCVLQVWAATTSSAVASVDVGTIGTTITTTFSIFARQ